MRETWGKWGRRVKKARVMNIPGHGTKNTYSFNVPIIFGQEVRLKEELAQNDGILTHTLHLKFIVSCNDSTSWWIASSHHFCDWENLWWVALVGSYEVVIWMQASLEYLWSPELVHLANELYSLPSLQPFQEVLNDLFFSCFLMISLVSYARINDCSLNRSNGPCSSDSFSHKNSVHLEDLKYPIDLLSRHCFFRPLSCFLVFSFWFSFLPWTSCLRASMYSPQPLSFIETRKGRGNAIALWKNKHCPFLDDHWWFPLFFFFVMSLLPYFYHSVLTKTSHLYCTACNETRARCTVRERRMDIKGGKIPTKTRVTNEMRRKKKCHRNCLQADRLNQHFVV